eukprot:GHVL01024500.1.p1 GENE.GHVL01024500.1~~GHVL01024500.1.p1  ORF type:complete len:392 (+),score=15.22 GHVL01024500.1:62-1237(+)
MKLRSLAFYAYMLFDVVISTNVWKPQLPDNVANLRRELRDEFTTYSRLGWTLLQAIRTDPLYANKSLYIKVLERLQNIEDNSGVPCPVYMNEIKTQLYFAIDKITKSNSNIVLENWNNLTDELHVFFQGKLITKEVAEYGRLMLKKARNIFLWLYQVNDNKNDVMQALRPIEAMSNYINMPRACYTSPRTDAAQTELRMRQKLVDTVMSETLTFPRTHEKLSEYKNLLNSPKLQGLELTMGQLKALYKSTSFLHSPATAKYDFIWGHCRILIRPDDIAGRRSNSKKNRLLYSSQRIARFSYFKYWVQPLFTKEEVKRRLVAHAHNEIIVLSLFEDAHLMAEPFTSELTTYRTKTTIELIFVNMENANKLIAKLRNVKDRRSYWMEKTRAIK